MNPRQHSAIPLHDSPLNACPERSAEFSAGPVPGEILRECPLQVGGKPGYLTDLLGPCFTALLFTDAGEVPPALDAAFLRIKGRAPFEGKVIRRTDDSTGKLYPLYGAQPGSVYLVRPDGHVMARWRSALPDELEAAVLGALRGGAQATYKEVA